MLLAVIVLALLLIFGECIYDRSDTRPFCPCGSISNRVSTRVVGGHDARKGKFPYASCLIYGPDEDWLYRYKNEPLQPVCGGSLVSARHVLTAAHCLDNNQTQLVHISGYSLYEDRFYLRRVKTIIRYPEYNPDANWYDDIALIELDQDVDWRKAGKNGDTVKVRTAILPPPNLRIDPGTTVTVFGWGTREAGYSKWEYDYSDVLQSLEMPVVKIGECQKKYSTPIKKKNMLCAGGVRGHDVCLGDSAGGLVVRLGSVDVLCGVASFGGDRCGLKDVPGVYTRVSSYAHWIYQHTKSSYCKPCFYPNFSLINPYS